MIGPGDASTAMEIRDQALRVWRAVPRSNKVEWDRLFEIRHSNVDIFKKGHELLKIQGVGSSCVPGKDSGAFSAPSGSSPACCLRLGRNGV